MTINLLPPVPNSDATERLDTGGSFVRETVIVLDTAGGEEFGLDARARTRADFFLRDNFELVAVSLFLDADFLAAFFLVTERLVTPERFAVPERFFAAETLRRAVPFFALAVFFDARTFFEAVRAVFFLVDRDTRFRFALAFTRGAFFFFVFFFFAATIHSEQMK